MNKFRHTEEFQVQKCRAKRTQSCEKKPREKKGDGEYDKLSKMTLEERMAYYKKEYGDSPEEGKKKPQPQRKGQNQSRKGGQSNPSRKAQAQQNRKPQAQQKNDAIQRKEEPKKPAPAPAKEVKVVKKGFFSRIVDKLRGK